MLHFQTYSFPAFLKCRHLFRVQFGVALQDPSKLKVPRKKKENMEKTFDELSHTSVDLMIDGSPKKLTIVDPSSQTDVKIQQFMRRVWLNLPMIRKTGTIAT